MVVLIAVLLTLIPAIAILYPFLRGDGGADLVQDESSLQSELSRRWDAAITGLKGTDLEWSIGNLTEEDYRWLREQYMAEAAAIMKAMELEEEQEQELLAQIESEVRSLSPPSREVARE